MKKKFNVGVIGVGHIANKFHIPSFIKNIKIGKVILFDPNEENLNKTAKKFNIRLTYTNLNKMFLENKIKILNICTPPSLHFSHIIKAIEKNINIIVEKPFVISMSQFKKIKRKILNKNIHCYCAYHQRARPISQKIKKIIDDKKIGEIYYIKIIHRQYRAIPEHSKYFSQKKYSGGGPLIDLGTHFFDLVGWFLKFPKISKISNNNFNKITQLKNEKKNLPFKKYDNEELSIGSFKFDNGCLVDYEISYVMNTEKKVSSIEIFGTKGSIKWPDGKLLLIKNNKKIIRKIKYNSNLASHLQTNDFIKKLKNKFNKIHLDEIEFSINLIEKLYKAKK
jgi:predicted dehydrogenase